MRHKKFRASVNQAERVKRSNRPRSTRNISKKSEVFGFASLTGVTSARAQRHVSSLSGKVRQGIGCLWRAGRNENGELAESFCGRATESWVGYDAVWGNDTMHVRKNGQ